jgi:hypothetical protein
VDRTYVGIARARDGIRTPDRRTPDRRTPDGGAPGRAGPSRRRRLAGVGALAVVATLATVPGGPLTAPAAHAATSKLAATSAQAGASGTSGAALTLLGQTAFVTPGGAFSLRLGLSPKVPSTATLSVTVYTRVTSRSALAEAFAGTVPGSVLAGSAPLQVSSLPPDPRGGVTVEIALGAGGPAPAVPGSTFSADLGCTAGSCGGVYPVRVSLTAGSSTKNQLTTALVFEDPPSSTQRLRVALLAPLALPATAASAGGTLPPTDQGALTSLGDLVGALGAHPEVPVTLLPSPQAMAALAVDPRPRARQVLTSVQSLAASPSHQTVAGPYAAVDAAALVGAALPAELGDQVQRGAQTLAGAGVRAIGGTWVAWSPVDEATLGTLAALGATHAVLPETSITGAPSHLTPTQPVSVSTGRAAAMTVAEADPTLAAHLAAASGPEAVLAANQLLADLALAYYEEPNLDTPRGVVALAPASWSPDGAFVDATLAGLTANPVLEPVTLTTWFSEVPGGHVATTRRTTSDAGNTLPARAIRSVRGRVDAFATAVSDPAVARGLGDLILAAESSLLRPARQSAGIAGAGAALDAQLRLLNTTADTIRLTSSTAHVPITILKAAPYSVTAVMVLSSDKLLFPTGNTRTVLLSRATNAVYVDMKARSAGVFKVTVSLTSPTGGLVMDSRQLTVRSMSTSTVAIVLSLGAVAVLLAWWAQTSWRRRGARSRRGAHARRRGGRSAVARSTELQTGPDASSQQDPSREAGAASRAGDP